MKLLILCDPGNSLVPVGEVLSALSRLVQVEVITFNQVSHRTNPNFSFEIKPIIDQTQSDILLWVEGGPMPKDIATCQIPKACWLVNAHIETSLVSDFENIFQLRFTTWRKITGYGTWTWMPLSGSSLPDQENIISFIGSDPITPSNAKLALAVRKAALSLSAPTSPITIVAGQKSVPHWKIFEQLATGSVVLVDTATDIRDIGSHGEHLLVYPTLEELPEYISGLVEDKQTALRIACNGKSVYEHLHTHELRAYRLLENILPRTRILSGQAFRPSISVITVSYRYLNRLRIYLDSLARQEMPEGTLEIVVADPESPDGLASYLQQFSLRHPSIRIVHLPLQHRYHRNRGYCISRAFQASSGKIIVSTDCDIVFEPSMLSKLETLSKANPNMVFGIRRAFVDRKTTEEILAGRINPIAEFSRLSQSESDGEPRSELGVLGYCQVLQRDAFARAGYPEELHQVNQSDIVFLERLQKHAGVLSRYRHDLCVLHLWHPRNWSGTTVDL